MKHANIQWCLSVILFALVAILQGCKQDTPEPIPPPEPEDELATRTLLIYMVANNSLGSNSFDKADIREIEQAAADGVFNKARVVAYHASSKGIVLKEFTKDKTDTLKVYDTSESSVSISRMRQVIDDVKELAPAHDYGLVLWSHATGWIQDGIDEPASSALRSYGDDSRKKMNITSLATALEDSEMSYIYFDCCYMASVEALYELRKCAPYIVASPTEDPAEGLPYHIALEHLLNTDVDVETALVKTAKTTYEYFDDKYTIGDCPYTVAVVKSSGLEKLSDVTKEIYSGATSCYNSDYKYQKFKSSGICYYYDFEQYVESICEDADALARWKAALADAVCYHANTAYVWSAFPIEYCCGLSTYILRDESGVSTGQYYTLSWYRDIASHLFFK